MSLNYQILNLKIEIKINYLEFEAIFHNLFERYLIIELIKKINNLNLEIEIQSSYVIFFMNFMKTKSYHQYVSIKNDTLICLKC